MCERIFWVKQGKEKGYYLVLGFIQLHLYTFWNWICFCFIQREYYVDRVLCIQFSQNRLILQNDSLIVGCENFILSCKKFLL